MRAKVDMSQGFSLSGQAQHDDEGAGGSEATRIIRPTFQDRDPANQQPLYYGEGQTWELKRI